jgi:hypothetical protein
MAWELVNEVLDHAPAGLTPAEVLVLVAIAEYVRTEDHKHGIRRTSRPAADIARRAHMTLDGLRKAVQRLAKNGLDIRVELATGKDGRPVYAVPGKSSTYKIPPLSAATGGQCICETCTADIPTKVIHKEGAEPPLKAVPQYRLDDPEGGTPVPPRRYPSTAKAVPQYRLTGSGFRVIRVHAGARVREAPPTPDPKTSKPSSKK